jgi:alkylmercury lyase
MTQSELETISRRLAEGLCCEEDALAMLCTQLLRLLAEGRPVSSERLAAALDRSHEEVEAAIRQLPNVEFDERGAIIAAGLSLSPTPHQFLVNGHSLYTWCAIDTLMYPVVLQQTAQVASCCPVTGRAVRLTVTPERIVAIDPADALVSVVVLEQAAARCDVRGVFCRHVHFLAGPDAGAAWRAAHPGASLVSVEGAYALARLLARTRYRTGTSGATGDT